MSTLELLAHGAVDTLRDGLRAQGIAIADGPWLHRLPVQRVGALLVADEPAQALLSPLEWLHAQAARGPGDALVLGLVGHGLRSRALRCFVATPTLVLAVEQTCPLLGDDAEQGRQAAEAAVQLCARAVAAAAACSGPRVAALITDRQGAAAAPAADWAGVDGPLPPNPLAWLELLDLLTPGSRA